jgi:succinate dehydrogenase/fumarate reductase flavoprotein subunit
MRSAPEECDVLVVGSGAAGLSTALTAAALGLDVVVCEHADVLGGTSALSGGEVWIPLNRQTVFHGGSHPSALTLEVLEGGHSRDGRTPAAENP